MTPYTYKITHTPTGQWYYGVRYANSCHPDDLWVKYFTSSRIIKNLLEADGSQAFKVEVRQIFETKESAIKWELRALRRIWRWPGCLNHNAFPAVSPEARARGNATKMIVQENGLTIAQIAGRTWKQRQYEIDLKTGLTKKEIRRRKFNDSLTNDGRERIRSASSKRLKENNPSKNPITAAKIAETLRRGMADGTIKTTRGMKFPSISEKLMGNQFVVGLVWVNNGHIDKRVQRDEIPDGFIEGRLQSIKGHVYEDVTCPHCNKRGGGGNMTRYHFDRCKHKHSTV
jgi:hypothetical protein